MPFPMPELPPVTIAFWPFSTLLIGQAGITGSGNCPSMNLVSGVCIRPTDIVNGLSIVNVFEFMFFKGVLGLWADACFCSWSNPVNFPYRLVRSRRRQEAEIL